ncbi:MAG TPA: DUF4123 domain-containing protein [Thermoanaerobaculia bacterium]
MTAPAGALWPSTLDAKSRIYALLDAARDERIYPALLQSGCEWLCLYRGNAAATLADAAPYLVRLERGAHFTEWLLEHGWGNSWGVFLHARVAIERLKAHFRRLVLAQLPDGRMVFFRFYDPRVLRVYLPTCTAGERETLFGPVDRFIFENGVASTASAVVESAC